MTFTTDELRFRIDSLTATRPAYATVLSFLAQVRGIQETMVPDGGMLPPPPSSGEAKTHQEGGFPLVDAGTLDYSVPTVPETAAKLLELLQAREGEGGDDLSAYAFLGAAGDGDALRIFRMAALHDLTGLEAAATARGLNPGILTFVARGAIKPLFTALRDQLSGLLPGESWDHGTCPCCGNPPAMDRLEGEGGKRFLGCSLCELDWRFPRMQCPACGTQDQKELRRFSDESGGEASVFLCDACHHYVKTIDGRLLDGERVVLPVEEVVTLHLDIVARRLGYLPPSVGSFAFPVGADQA